MRRLTGHPSTSPSAQLHHVPLGEGVIGSIYVRQRPGRSGTLIREATRTLIQFVALQSSTFHLL